MARVTVEQIREALRVTGGQIAPAARILGLARNNLYKRLANNKMSPDSFRGNSATSAPATPTDTRARETPHVESSEVASGVSKSQSAIFPPHRRARNFPHVSSALTSPPQPEEPKLLRVSRTIYLRPDQAQALDDACLDLPGVLREKLSPSKLIEKFMDDCFATWIASKLEPGRKPRKDANGGKGGTK
jgi:hypothetical protein